MADRAPGQDSPGEGHACYNCGERSHHTFACPEPTRAMPAGLEAERRRQAAGQPFNNRENHSSRHHRGAKHGSRMTVTRYGPPAPPGPPPANPYSHPGTSLPPAPAPYPPQAPPTHHFNQVYIPAPHHPPPPPPPHVPNHYPPANYGPPPQGAYGSYAAPPHAAGQPPYPVAIPPTYTAFPPRRRTDFQPEYPLDRYSSRPHDHHAGRFREPSVIPPSYPAPVPPLGPFHGPPEPYPLAPPQAPQGVYSQTHHTTYHPQTGGPGGAPAHLGPPLPSGYQEHAPTLYPPIPLSQPHPPPYGSHVQHLMSPEARSPPPSYSRGRGDHHYSRGALRSGRGGRGHRGKILRHQNPHREASSSQTRSQPRKLPRDRRQRDSSPTRPISTGLVTDDNVGLPIPRSTPSPIPAEDDFEWDLKHSFVKHETKEADPVGAPLPDYYNDLPTIPPKYGATCIISSFFSPDSQADFSRPVCETDAWNTMKFDVIFERRPGMVIRRFSGCKHDCLMYDRSIRRDPRQPLENSNDQGLRGHESRSLVDCGLPNKLKKRQRNDENRRYGPDSKRHRPSDLQSRPSPQPHSGPNANPALFEAQAVAGKTPPPSYSSRSASPAVRGAGHTVEEYEFDPWKPGVGDNHDVQFTSRNGDPKRISALQHSRAENHQTLQPSNGRHDSGYQSSPNEPRPSSMGADRAHRTDKNRADSRSHDRRLAPEKDDTPSGGSSPLDELEREMLGMSSDRGVNDSRRDHRKRKSTSRVPNVYSRRW